MLKKIFKLTLLVFSTLLLISWGNIGHKKISKNTELSFKGKTKQFLLWVDYLAEHAPDADTRKSVDTTEGPKHYIDIDNYPDFVSKGKINQSLEDNLKIYGKEFVKDNGYLPWATLAAYDSLKSCFARKDFVKAQFFAADLGHYVADGYMPLHISKNYNGQLTGNKGIHARYEIDMIDYHSDEIIYKGGKINRIENVEEYIFNYLYENNKFVDSIISADNYAQKISSDLKSKEYIDALWYKTKGFTVELFKGASHSLAELIYTAWVEADKPKIK